MRSWETFVALEKTVKNTLTSLKAVSELQNPAIRERHWHQLMTSTKVSSNFNLGLLTFIFLYMPWWSYKRNFTSYFLDDNTKYTFFNNLITIFTATDRKFDHVRKYPIIERRLVWYWDCRSRSINVKLLFLHLIYVVVVEILDTLLQ